jgi:hypothetical protein
LKIDAGPVVLAGSIGVMHDHLRLTRNATASTTSTRTVAPDIVSAHDLERKQAEGADQAEEVDRQHQGVDSGRSQAGLVRRRYVATWGKAR